MSYLQCDIDLKFVRNFIKEKYIRKGKKFVKFDQVNPEVYKFMKEYTNHLGDNLSITQMVWHILAESPNPPICKKDECNNTCKWSVSKQDYREYCSTKCSNSDKKKIEKTKEHYLEKHGVEFGKDPKIRNKIKTTNTKRYGNNSPFSSKEVQEKIKETNLEKYGSENVFQSESIKDFIRENNLKKYGHTIPVAGSLKPKVQETNLKKYGSISPLGNSKIYSKTMKKRSINVLGIETYKKLYDKDWLYDQHHIKKKTCKEISKDIGVATSTVCRAMHKHNVRILGFYNSLPEIEIFNYISKNNIKVIKNYRELIYPNEVDLYIPDHNLAIEFCGLFWHNELNKSKNYHHEKYKKCKEKGVRLITIFEDEWVYKKNIVLKTINRLLNIEKEETVYARKTTPSLNVSNKDREIFLGENHIQGNGSGSINAGLFNDDSLVALMTFIKTKDSLLLNRYATSCNVPGGFSKLLKYVERNVKNINKIITFADLRWSEGDLYLKNGFRCIKYVKPDYDYILGDKRFHKFQFRKKNMSKKLKNYNEALSEHDNMLANKIYRIYNCGLLKFEKKL